MLNFALMKQWENWLTILLMVLIPFILVHFLIARKAENNG